ncbi:hypothetical protein [Croceicoccus sediminis]|uniref:hypothetical protein n=1 Tax=Croceicoccus sediminis TaxID=2571150 RepID=UPI00118238E7|nr:hypothetical protein [Croceicoccus sediminis]
MNLNQLLHDHQRAKLNAQRAPSREDCETYSDIIGHSAMLIADWRRAKGLSNIGWPQDERLKDGCRP